MKTTIDMAREAGGRAQQDKNCDVEYLMSADALKAFEALVRADEREEFQRWFDAVTAQHKQLILAEREACAKVCEEIYTGEEACGDWPTPEMCAAAIRARSKD